jgi:hypothetical protein
MRGKVAMRFRGLGPCEIDQLTDKAREFAREAGRSRRLYPIYVDLYIAADALRKGEVLPIDMTGAASALVMFICSIICRALERKIETARPRALVVWLRRFHQVGAGYFPIHELFEQLSRWGVLACTLSDDVVYKSTLAERTIRKWADQRVMQLPEMAWLVTLSREILFFLTVIFLVGVAFVLMATQRFSGIEQFIFLFLYLVLLVVLSKSIQSVAVRMFYRSEKFQKLYKPIFVSEMANSFSLSAAKAPDFFSKIAGNLRQQREAMDQGFVALVVSDADWQAVVEAAIVRANIVLFDVTELSKNLQWELEHVAKNTKLERVVLAFGFSGDELGLDENWQRHPSCRLLDECIGLGWRNRCRKFSYPQRIDTHDERMLTEYMHRLVMEVYEAAAIPE